MLNRYLSKRSICPTQNGSIISGLDSTAMKGGNNNHRASATEFAFSSGKISAGKAIHLLNLSHKLNNSAYVRMY